jgi:hypothetical protein
MLSPFGPRQIDLGNPVADHPLNRNRVMWLYGLSNTSGGTRWFDLLGAFTGTLTNGPTWVPTGRGDSGVQFDGVNDYVGCGQAGATALTALTVTCWFRPGTLAHDVLVTRYDTNTNNRSWQLATRNPGGTTIECSVTPNGNGAGIVTVNGATSLVVGQWYRGGFTYSASSYVRVWLNGVQDGQSTTSIPAAAFSTAVPTQVGARESGAGAPFTGQMSDVSIWSRPLSASEMWLDYLWSRQGYPAGGPLRRRTPVVYSFGPVPVGAGGWGPLVGGYRNQRVVRG